MRRVILVGALLVALAGLVAVALATAGPTYYPALVGHQLEIRFEPVGCHSWALDGGAFKAEQTVQLRAGQSIVVTNHDVCPHTLVETSGAPISIESLAPAAQPKHVTVVGYNELVPSARGVMTGSPGELATANARAVATFYQPGTYVLVTDEGETTLPGDWSTVGPDSRLVLHVQVIPGPGFPE
jgi:hypothetical protein